MLFTKNMQPIAECGADLNGEGDVQCMIFCHRSK